MRQRGRIRVGSAITIESLVTTNRVMSARKVFMAIDLGELEGIAHWASKMPMKWQLEGGTDLHPEALYHGTA
jgi:hypothetical protein